MPRRIQATYTVGPRYDIAVMGDSLTDGVAFVNAGKIWPALLQTSLRAAGCGVVVRNFARSGNTTQNTSPNMQYRFAAMTRVRVPKVGIIFGGVNDPGAGLTQGQTQANIEAMIQSLLDSGAQYVVVVSPQFLNYTSGGESTSQTKPGGTYTQVYDAQVAAVAARAAANPTKGVVFCDLWNAMKALIVAGTDTLGSASWHVAGTNQHLNAYGQQIVANTVRAAIQAQTGWLAALKA